MYKMVLKGTKETWGNCGIKTVKYYNEEEDIIELWQKNEWLQNTNKTYKY